MQILRGHFLFPLSPSMRVEIFGQLMIAKGSNHVYAIAKHLCSWHDTDLLAQQMAVVWTKLCTRSGGRFSTHILTCDSHLMRQ